MRIKKLALLFLFFFFSSAFAAEQLIIEPEAGREPILSAIKNANSSIDLVIYGFTDKKILKALIDAKKQNKKIRIVLEPHPFKSEDENNFAIQKLEAADIDLQNPNPDFKLTHQKTFLIDNQKAIIMTFNLTKTAFKNERNFALVTDDPAVVHEISDVFTGDRENKKIGVKHPDLLWSPNNSRAKILDFIKGAHSEIDIYAQDITDYQMIGELAKAAHAGKKIKIVMSPPKSGNNRKMDYLKRAGAQVRFSENLIIHAKVIMVDHDRAIIGSINLTEPSMNDNRELSIVTRDPKVVGELEKTFEADEKKAVIF